MAQYYYDVTIHTQLGDRSGTMQIDTHNDQIHGALSILGKTRPCSGVQNGDGNCILTGEIVTLLRRHCFTATGTFDSDRIELTLQSMGHKYRLTGTASEKETDN